MCSSDLSSTMRPSRRRSTRFAMRAMAALWVTMMIDPANLDPDEKLKYEVAEEIGLLDKVMTEGWKSLTSKETGRIGGLVTRKKKQRSGGQNISLQR